ncbi:hypothetical protein [Lysinibacillus sp. FSL K6-3209]|uniref:DUF7662 domain-containing protein n=1 Tax=Lysinibacillus sp. FSL K6-3209 TaxID=2921497 RepID=UPI0030DD06EF
MGDKYLPLYQYLANRNDATVMLDFEKIESIIGCKLPNSAYQYPAWWANQKNRHSQTGAWMDAGYFVQSVSFGKTVTFVKEAVSIQLTTKNVSETNTQHPMDKIALKVSALKTIVIEGTPKFDGENLDEQFHFIRKLSRTIGNISNDLSYLSCHYIEAFLNKNFKMEFCSVLTKAQGAAGLDVDEVTVDGQRIIGELKTTYPYAEYDLGAAQKNNFKKDFERLQTVQAEFKYFFVIEEKTFDILKEKYRHLLQGITLVLLPDALDDVNAVVCINE